MIALAIDWEQWENLPFFQVSNHPNGGIIWLTAMLGILVAFLGPTLLYDGGPIATYNPITDEITVYEDRLEQQTTLSRQAVMYHEEFHRQQFSILPSQAWRLHNVLMRALVLGGLVIGMFWLDSAGFLIAALTLSSKIVIETQAYLATYVATGEFSWGFLTYWFTVITLLGVGKLIEWEAAYLFSTDPGYTRTTKGDTPAN